MTNPTYDQLVAQALGALETASDMLDYLGQDPHVPFLAATLIQGAQVYATLAQAEAEKDAQRSFEERNPKRPPVYRGPSGPVRPVTPINKFQKDEG